MKRTRTLRFASLALFAAGLYVAFVLAPANAAQGETYRIAFVHVPAAWLSLVLFAAIALCAAVDLIADQRIAAIALQALAPTAALFAFLALWTGAVWGKPTWGTWWTWDARLTTQLVLLLLCLAVIGLNAAIADVRRGDRACAVLALGGAASLPLIYSSLQWASSHPSAPLTLIMLAGMALMAAAFTLHSLAMALARMRCVLLEREAAP